MTRSDCSQYIEPAHYRKGKIEVIDFIEDQGFNYHEGCIIKYVCRYKGKDGLRDLYKAEWYLRGLIARIDAEQSGGGDDTDNE